ncbi:hypothetical protein GQ53DRAFT_699385 [Thozetella sp. PMI_491]|nr:hypothetical protein GQ53DRAFT_699385 [Thozetella sp. PMI_491]
MGTLTSALAGMADSSTSRTSTPVPQTSNQCDLSTPPPAPSQRMLSPEASGSSASRQRRRSRSSSTALQQRHEVRDEMAPKQRFHEQSFQDKLRDSKEGVSQLVELLSSSSLHNDPDTMMKRLFKQAEDLSSFQSPATRTVGFVGDSGVGKSSLINSLLDIKGLARTSNSGAACTCVVTEYHYHDQEDFLLEVEWFSEEEIDAQILELLSAYRFFHLANLSNEEKEEAEEKATVAYDTFQAMFRHRLRDEGGKDFLLDNDETRILDVLAGWAAERNVAQETVTERIVSPQQCSTRLMALTSELISSEEPADWPFISKIRVFTNAHILSKGLILVDLPGLRDLNSARRKITERHLLKVDEILAICLIGRATTDQGVAAVFELARRARLSNIGIVCTKSDDIQANEAVKDWKDRRRLRLQDLMDTLEEHKTELKNLEDELSFFDQDPDDMPEDEKEEFRQLSWSQRQAKKREAAAAFELTRYLIQTRNEIVSSELEKTYATKIRNNTLRVFCVSNILYWENRDRYQAEALPFLELSGILGLRKHCISIVAEAQYRAASLYMSHEIPTVLNSVQLWVESGSGSLTAERKASIRNALDKVDIVLKELTSPDTVLNEVSMQRLFRAQVTQNQRHEDWKRSARSAASDWSGWHHASYSAFCRNFGDYCTPAVGRRNWNEEAIHTMVSDMRVPWQNMLQGIQERQEQSGEIAESVLQRGIDILNNELHGEAAQVQSLITILRHRRRLVAADVETEHEEVNDELALLETDSYSGIRSSFIGAALESSYRACNSESGRGSDSRRKDIMEGRLSSTRLFLEMSREQKTRFSDITRRCDERINEKLLAHLAAVQENIITLRDENVALEGEKDPAFKTRVEEGLARLKGRHMRIQQSLGEL